jgi:MFS family permease
MDASGAGETRSTGGVMRALAAGCVGNFVEWYDFAIYSYSVTIIATLFFPAGNRAAAIIAAFALYGVAFLARPVGGLFWGSLGDRIGRKPLLLIGTPGFILLSLSGYLLASSGTFLGAIVGQLLVALPWSFVVSAVVVILVEIFPTRVRYSGASIGYNLGYMIFGGTAPIVATYLVSATGSNSAPAIYLIVVAVLVLPAVFMLPETRGVDLLRGGDRAQPTESARPTMT